MFVFPYAILADFRPYHAPYISAMLILLILTLSATGTFGTDPDSQCTDVVQRGYEVAAFFGGLSVKANFTGQPIDLLQFYNQRVQAVNGIFNNQSSRLLLGYDDEVIALPYFIGKVVDFTESHEFVPAKPDSSLDMSSEETIADFGYLDPSSITLFQDIIFAGQKKYDIEKKDFVRAVDPRIIYSPGNHFDLTDKTSVAGDDGSKTLIGIVNGNKIYRQKCERKVPVNLKWDCGEGNCKEASVEGDNYCFYVQSCLVAYGPEQLFYDILVIPEPAVQKPALPLLTTTAAPRTTTTAEMPIRRRRRRYAEWEDEPMTLQDAWPLIPTVIALVVAVAWLVQIELERCRERRAHV
ncbi:hypothetical protein L596_016944 [Steinernema carpocapsae]|uniref:Uncharacterized protein n=1 Tax=Steinernema carpocapsae TaxID=34508 RepID=A0A4U5N073_STECR|nr:hypothetical protein L596_016944 [Steinernema carpocapsae]